MNLKLKRLHPDAIIPTRGTDGAAGYDLYTIDGGILAEGNRIALPTGWAIQIPEDHVGLIWPRSGLSINRGLDRLAGVIDSDFRGHLKVALINHSGADYEFSKGDRIAQLLIQPIARPILLEVDELDDTTRGEGGFGSTGA